MSSLASVLKQNFRMKQSIYSTEITCQMIGGVTESPKLMHLGNLAVNFLFTLQPIITLRVIYTIGLPMEKTREGLVNSHLVGSSQMKARPFLPGKELCYMRFS